MRTRSLLVVLLAGSLLPQCGGTEVREEAKTTRVSSAEIVLSPQEMITAIEAIDKAKAEKRAGGLLDDYEKRSKASPKDRYLKFLYYYAIGDRDQAWQRINGMTYLDAGFAWAYLGRALIYHEWGSTLDKAEADYKKFLEAVPDVPYVYRKLGNLAIHREFYDDARKFFDKAVSLDPASADAHYGLALSKWYGNDLEGAKAAMLKATEVDPKHFQARFQLASLLLRLKDQNGALDAFLKAAEVDPKHFETRKQAAILLEARGDKAAAAEQYEAALAAQSGDLGIAIKLGEIYGELGIADKELQAFERAKAIDPGNAEVLSALGQLYLKSSDRQRAEVVLMESYKSNPSDVSALVELARIAAWREDYVQALDRYIELLDKQRDHKEGRAEFDALLKKINVPAKGFSCQLRSKTFDTCLANVLERQIRPYLIGSYRERVKKNPELQGAVEVEIRVDKEGQVRGVRFVENQLKGRGFDALIYGCFWMARFPTGPGGKWSYRMEFQP